VTRKKFRTPPTLPETDQCRGIVIPSSQQWLGIFSDALLELTKTYNYVQVEPTDLTPEEVAAVAYSRYVQWLDSDCASGCPAVELPDGESIWRRSPTTGNFEYLDPTGSGDWLEPTGDDAIPPPTERPEIDEYDRICSAAANAVESIRLTLEAALDAWNAQSGPAQAIIDMGVAWAAAAGAAFYPPMLGLLTLAGAAFNMFFELMDAITWSFWDDEFESALVCSFRANATDSGGVVTFDYEQIVEDLWGQIWTRSEYVLLVAQVQYILSIVGSQGINDAGCAELVTGDCSGCETWCYEGTLEDIGFTALIGYFTAGGGLHSTLYGGYWPLQGTLDVDTTQCVITRIAAYVSATGGTSGVIDLSVTPSNGPIRYTNMNEVLGGIGYWRYTDDNTAWYTTTDSSQVYVYAAYLGGDDRNLSIDRIRIMGTGRNPFGASNC